MMKIERILTQVCGISGMGKSYLTKTKLIPEIEKVQPVIIFDKMAEYGGANKKDVPGGWKNFNSGKHFLEETRKAGSIKDVNVIQCTTPEDYKTVIGFIYKLSLPVCLVLDEAHFIFDEPDLKSLSNILKNLARFGRHKGISLILISQRIMDIPPNVRSQFEGVITFKQVEMSDVDSLKKKGYEESEKVLDLEKKEFKIYGIIPEQIKKALKNG